MGFTTTFLAPRRDAKAAGLEEKRDGKTPYSTKEQSNSKQTLKLLLYKVAQSPSAQLRQPPRARAASAAGSGRGRQATLNTGERIRRDERI